MGLSSLRPLAVVILCFISAWSLAQAPAHILITNPIDESRLTVLKGNTHPMARAEFDQGAAPPDLPMSRMLLVLKRSEDQEGALRSLIDAQQDKASPNYHKWLTPEDFGAQFGPSDSDIQQVTAWLQSHGFQIAQVGKGRTTLEFSGTAAQVQETFHTSIHKYVVKGEEHWANATDPQIPTALTPVVGGVESLNNFPRKPMLHVGGVVSRSKATGKMTPLHPLFTIPSTNCGVQAKDCYGVGPYDFATIYSVASLWSAAPAIDGTGQTIAIVGETDINAQDVADFRNFFGLPPLTGSQLNIIHNGPAPGILTDGEETESDLDVEWSSAVAKGATIDFVVSESTETTAGVDLSAEYIVDNNLAPVLSESYGLCELGLGTAGNSFYSQLWQQAAAEGITVLIASGDSGAAGCNSQDSPAPSPATFGLAVSGFASTPYNVAVGGTDFNDLTNASSYWSSSNNSSTQASALSYIPETTWNDSCTNPVFGTLLGFSTNAETNCNNSVLGDFLVTVGGSGGKSTCTVSDTSGDVSSCSTGYTKPAWQTGSGVPQDGVRDIPDVSLFAASGSPSGSFYIVCEADQVSGASSCAPADASTEFLGVGGTSASAPAFAGIMALVNQKTTDRQGNANYVLYKLAATQPGVFNEVPAGGTIAMPCAAGSPNCTISRAGDQYGILAGYNTSAGYDLATGLGSVNVANLVNKWNTVSFNSSTTVLTSLSPTSITHGAAVNVSIKITGSAGIATGTVALIGGPSGAQFIDSHALDVTGTATWTTKLLPGGSYSLHAHYAGDGNYGASDSASVSVMISKENSSAQAELVTFNPITGQLLNPDATSVVYGSTYLLRVNVANSADAVCANYPQIQSGCASGLVALSDNGTPLDAGTYALNNLGYFEDGPMQLSGGSHSIQAHYTGDNSFNASAVTDAITVTLAPTFFSEFSAPGQVPVNQSTTVNAEITSASMGGAPTGTFSFFLDGKILSSNILYNPIAPCGNDFYVCLQATTTVTATTGGSHTIAATYSGDANYASSASHPATFNALYQTTTSLSANSLNPQPGGTVALTALIDTTAKNLTPTGGVKFPIYNAGTYLPGNPVLTPVTDANGNSALQATLSFTPSTNNITFNAVYNGDSNFESSGSSNISISVAGTDFLLSVGSSPLIVQPGQMGAIGLTIDGQASYNGTINFSPSSCSGLPAESSCSFNPPSVTGTGATSVFVATTAPHPLVRQASHLGILVTGLGITTITMFIFGAATSNGRRYYYLSVIFLAFLMPGLGCGGGGGSNSGSSGNGTPADPGTPAGTYIVTVTGVSGSLSHTATVTLIVQ